MAKQFINFGHGDNDPGAIGQKGTKEKDVVAIIGMKVVKILQANGEEVKYYQSGDLNSISTQANNWKADYFWSFHANSAADSSAHGAETYALSAGGKGEEMAKSVQSEMMAVNGLTNRGVKFANYSVLRKTNMPAVLIELAFISNSTEEALLLDSAWQDKVALAIAKGILKMIGKKVQQPVSTTPTERWRVKVNGNQQNIYEDVKQAIARYDAECANAKPGDVVVIERESDGKVTSRFEKPKATPTPSPTPVPPVVVPPVQSTPVPQPEHSEEEIIGKGFIELVKQVLIYFGLLKK